MSAPRPDDGAVLMLAARQLGIRVSGSWLERALRSHPAYPAITASLETLNELGLSVQPRRLLPEELDRAPTPFLALVDPAAGRLVLVTQVSKQSVTWGDGGGELQREATSEFRSRWKGVALLLRKESWAGAIEVDGALARWGVPTMSLVLLLGAVVATLARPGQTPAVLGPLFGLRLAGLVACLLLLLASWPQVPVLVRRMCRLGGGQCASAVRFDAARGWNIGWPDLGALYFLFGAFCILISAAAPAALALSTLAALPVAVSLLGYQAFVRRAWCPLCVAVHAVVGLEAVVWVASPALRAMALRELAEMQPALLAAAGLALAGWTLTRALFDSRLGAAAQDEAWARLRRSPQVLTSRLQSSQRVSFEETSASLWLGAVDAAEVLSMVMNPACRPCANELSAAQRLVKVLGAGFALRVLVVTTSEETARVARRVMAMSQSGHPDAAFEALLSWMREPKQPVVRWEAALPAEPRAFAEAGAQLERMTAWAMKHGVVHLPALVVDDRVLPQDVSVHDLAPFFRERLRGGRAVRTT